MRKMFAVCAGFAGAITILSSALAQGTSTYEYSLNGELVQMTSSKKGEQDKTYDLRIRYMRKMQGVDPIVFEGETHNRGKRGKQERPVKGVLWSSNIGCLPIGFRVKGHFEGPKWDVMFLMGPSVVWKGCSATIGEELIYQFNSYQSLIGRGH